MSSHNTFSETADSERRRRDDLVKSISSSLRPYLQDSTRHWIKLVPEEENHVDIKIGSYHEIYAFTLGISGHSIRAQINQSVLDLVCAYLKADGYNVDVYDTDASVLKNPGTNSTNAPKRHSLRNQEPTSDCKRQKSREVISFPSVASVFSQHETRLAKFDIETLNIVKECIDQGYMMGLVEPTTHHKRGYRVVIDHLKMSQHNRSPKDFVNIAPALRDHLGENCFVTCNKHGDKVVIKVREV